MNKRNKINRAEAMGLWLNHIALNAKIYVNVPLCLFGVQTLYFVLYLRFGPLEHMPGVSNVGLLLKGLITAYGLTMQNIILLHWGNKIVSTWLISFAVIVIIPFVFTLYLFEKRAEKASKKQHIRGASFITAEELQAQFEMNQEDLSLPLGSFNMPKRLENRHFFTIGLPGTGKSTMLRYILKALQARGERFVIFDCKGEFFAEFFREGRDLLFNPLDARCLGWNVFKEFKKFTDIETFGGSLIPPASGRDSFWEDSARSVFTLILRNVLDFKEPNNAFLWEALLEQEEILKEKLSSTRGGRIGNRYLQTDNEGRATRQTASTMATLMQYTKCFEYMADIDGSFTIERWLNDPNGGCIYITNFEDIEDTLRPILSLFIDLISKKLLSMPDDLSRRIFFLLDEFGSLQRLPSIVNLLTRGRSKGSAVFLGIQDNGQIERIYGEQTLETIENSCGNRVTFAVSGKTAEREAKYNIGEAEISSLLRSMKVEDDGNMGFSEKREKELAVLPSELAKMPDLTAIVKLRGYDFAISKWDWEASTPRHPRFIIKPGMTIQVVKEEIKLLPAPEVFQ